MRQVGLTFDPDFDIREVDQFGFVDIHESVLNGVVPSDLQPQQARFNNIENPRQVMSRPDDVFAGMRAERQYGSFVRHQREATPKGDAQS